MSMRARHPHRHRLSPHGFTLLEMLVVVALLSLVMLGLSSSFYSLAQTETRVDARLDQAGQLRANMHFLDQTLGRIVSRRRANVGPSQAQFWFEGQPNTVRWVGIMPARFGAGGRYFFQLSHEDGALIIRFAPWDDLPAFPAPQQMQARVLLDGVTQLSIQYRGENREGLDWRGQWNLPYHLPTHIMLDIATTSTAVPTKIVAMRKASGSAAAYEPSIGGGGRRRPQNTNQN